MIIPHLHKSGILPSSQISCRPCSRVPSGCICQQDNARFRSRFQPEFPDVASLTQSGTRRRPSHPGTNSLRTQTVREAALQRFHRIFLGEIKWKVNRKIEGFVSVIWNWSKENCLRPFINTTEIDIKTVLKRMSSVCLSGTKTNRRVFPSMNCRVAKRPRGGSTYVVIYNGFKSCYSLSHLRVSLVHFPSEHCTTRSPLDGVKSSAQL